MRNEGLGGRVWVLDEFRMEMRGRGEGEREVASEVKAVGGGEDVRDDGDTGKEGRKGRTVSGEEVKAE